MNPASLQNQLRELREQVALLQEALEQSRRENTLLRQKLDALARRFFGKKSEQLNAAQLELLLSGLAEGSVELSEEKEPPARPAPRHSRTHTRRIRTPDNLEVVREVIEPELVKAEPEHWKRIGQEVSRQLDYQPGKFFWQETVRPKYVRRDQRALPPMIAPAPERVAEGSLAAPGPAGPIVGQQILRPSALLPAGTNLLATARRVHRAAADGAVDRAERAVALRD